VGVPLLLVVMMLIMLVMLMIVAVVVSRPGGLSSEYAEPGSFPPF
jgi:hypothetical protein